MFLLKSNINISNLLNANESQLVKVLGKVVSREKHHGKYFDNFEKNGFTFFVRLSSGKASSFTIDYPNGKTSLQFCQDLGFDLSKARLIHRDKFGSEYFLGNNIVRLISWDGTKINSLQYHSKTHRM